jgi:drug/metabolite transporter (DMT)-like permease
MIKQKKNVAAGIFWTLVSCFFSGIMVNMVKHVSVDMHSAQIIFLRNIFAFLIFVPIVFYYGFAKFKTNKVGLHVLRSVTGLISMLIFFYSISKMNISVVTAISFTAPLFTAIFAIYFFKDKLNIHQTFALFVGFIGVMVVVQPGGEAFNPLSMLVLICTVFWALSGILIKKLSETDTPMAITFYMTIFMIIFSAPLALMDWAKPSLDNYIWVFGIALSSNLLQYSLAKSLTYADFSVVLPFDFTRLIFSAGFAYILFGENMDINAAFGSIIIVSAAFYAALNERRKIRRLTEISSIAKGL